jgi:hypothetical protein
VIKYSEVSENSRKFLALTGYTAQEFQALLSHFQVQFDQYVAAHRLDGKARIKRRYSHYRNSPLPTLADKLMFILIYRKQGATQEMHATLFGMHQPDANSWIHVLHPLLNRTLAALGELPVRDATALEQKELVQAVCFHDGTERPIPRPVDPDAQKLYYSGKKKAHTVKNVVISPPVGRILFLSPTCEGKKHDKKVTDEADYHLPKGSLVYQDTGFQGFTLEEVTLCQPKKKPRGKDLTPEEKANNRLISKVRIRVEHAIGGVKRYRLVKDKIRNWQDGFRDKVMETCCGLHNFRLNFRPWQYEALVT